MRAFVAAGCRGGADGRGRVRDDAEPQHAAATVSRVGAGGCFADGDTAAGNRPRDAGHRNHRRHLAITIGARRKQRSRRWRLRDLHLRFALKP